MFSENRVVDLKQEAGVLDEPNSAKPAQRSSQTGPPGHMGWTVVPDYIDWRAGTGTATALSGIS